MEYTLSALFDLDHTMAKEFLSSFLYPWDALNEIGYFLSSYAPKEEDGFLEIERGVFVHGTAKIAQAAKLCAPCIICAGAEVRHCAYVRGRVLVGENAVVGNSTELKNSILFDGVQVPHFNYVGDSILGYRAHLGAGVICANVRLDRRDVIIRGDMTYFTGRKKVGAIVGDFAEVGCNSVLAPGTVIQRRQRVLPLTLVKN